MLSPTEYYLAWLLYLFASVVALACFWWLTQCIKHKTVRLLLRLPAIAIVFMPAQQASDSSMYSPAIAAAALDFIAHGWEGAQPHVFSLLLAIAFALVIVFFIEVLRSRSLSRS